MLDSNFIFYARLHPLPIECSIVTDTSRDTYSTTSCTVSYYFWTNILLCTRILGTSSLLYKTTDGGVSWTSVSGGLPKTQTSYDFRFHAISVGTYAHEHNVFDICLGSDYVWQISMSSESWCVESAPQKISLNERMTVAFKGDVIHLSSNIC